MTSLIGFPTDSDGKVSTTEVGKEMVAASVQNFDPELASTIRNDHDWRGSYADHMVSIVRSASGTPERALENARSGLDYCYSKFSFGRDGKQVSLKQALVDVNVVASQRTLKTIKVQGEAKRKLSPRVPYQGTSLNWKQFLRVGEVWAKRGVVEDSALKGWKWVGENENEVGKGLEDTIFVVFGAGAALGPFVPLMELGATVAGIDLARPNIWKRLMKLAKSSNAGTLLAPTFDGEVCGCNLMEDIPEIVEWVCSLDPTKKLILGNYAYADGAKFIEVSLAMDLISQLVMRRRGRENVGLSYLCSPTDTFLVPSNVVTDSRSRYAAWGVSKVIRPVLSAATSQSVLQANFEAPLDSTEANIQPAERVVDCFVLQQGPNYALAKRIQHWRSILAKEEGSFVSTNIAPSSSTESVTKNALLAAGYGGAQFFPPVEIFEPETANHVMCLLLLHDIFNSKSVSQPSVILQHPMELFMHGAVHGGMWRMPYKLRTILEVAVFSYFLDKYKGFVSVGLGALWAIKYAKL